MKKLIFLASIIALVPLAVSAHVLKVDGQIGALLHTDPDDAPLVGKSTAFYLQFKDSAKPLILQSDYALDVTISSPTTATAEVLPVGWKYVGTGELDFKYTFPKKGDYTLKIFGAPRLSGFAPFTLSYDITAGSANADHDSDVDAFNSFDASVSSTSVPATTTATSTPSFFAMHGIHFVLFGGAIILVLILIARDLYVRRKDPVQPEA
jgi:hypothetical protein